MGMNFRNYSGVRKIIIATQLAKVTVPLKCCAAFFFPPVFFPTSPPHQLATDQRCGRARWQAAD